MSATFAPQGFLPVYHPSGQMIANLYEPTSATGPATAIYKGDPVVLSGDTDVITIAGTTVAILGIFAGCEYTNADGKPVYSPYWPGTNTHTNAKFWVYDDPFMIYEVQSVGSVPATEVGAAGDSVIAAGSSYTGVSASYLAAATSGTQQFRVMGAGQRGDNAFGDLFTWVRVLIVQSQLVSKPDGI